MSEDDPEYNVPMGSTTDISVLKSKDWFDWKDENVKLTPNQALTFQTSSSYRYKEKGVFASVNIEGSAFLTGIGSAPNALVQVAIVSYTSATPSKGNPVLEYLKRSGKPVGQHILFPTGGCILKDENNITEINPPRTTSRTHRPARIGTRSIVTPTLPT
ncbi:hypothetical protein MJO28_007785 [Puccinia striiformis f. sp. tritici]|uniref:Uncharacterized protein n=1 Tax=Puccinia striiformis f. sp. tritici TaxID=168172 RepID=A0ACC0EFK0_9BASI|nr:hypothetical protein MJO28_007785 [Puccinia striiformis f. sp. tritici]